MSASASEPRRLDAFVDGELELKSQLEMERQISDEPALARQVDDLRHLRAMVRDTATYHTAPDALRARLANRLGAPAPAADSAARARPAGAWHGTAQAFGRWLAWRPLGAALAFAAVLAVALNLVWMQSIENDRVVDEVVANHVRATLSQRLVDVASSDHHTVKPFLSAKLGFSPPVVDQPLPTCEFLGGRVDYVDGRPVAALAYRQGQHIVSSLIWPSTGVDRAPTYIEERGFRIAHWTYRQMEHWLISDVNREEFRALVHAIAAAEADR
jgi:anti-sigma factor RsiW